MFDYGDILRYLEEILLSLEDNELTLLEVQDKIQQLVAEIEDNAETLGDRLEDFEFDDLD